MATRIIFACVGNSCRSQMAEAFCRDMGREVECYSAGSRPAAEVQPDTVAVMKEDGIDIAGARPKIFDELAGTDFDYLVTMGCEVACPFLPGAKRVEWDIPDPYGKGITEYRKVRSLVRRRVRELLERLDLLRHQPEDDHQPLA